MGEYKYYVSDNSINIQNSCDIPKREFDNVLDEIRFMYPDNPVLVNRKKISLKFEWAVHNFLYMIGLFKTHTKDVDLNYPQKWYATLAYNIIGPLVWLLIK